MALLTDQEFNDRKVEAQRVVAGRTQLAQAIRDQAQQWIDKLQQRYYDHEKPSDWYTPYRILTRTSDKNSELCAAAFVAIEAMQEDRGAFPRFKLQNKAFGFPYSETASALNDDLREHRYWAQFCVPPPQNPSPISKKAAGKRKALTSIRLQPPDTASSQRSTMSPPQYPSSAGTGDSELLTRYQYPSERPSEEVLPSSLGAGQASLAARSSRASGHILAPSRTSAPFPSMSSGPHQEVPVTDAAKFWPKFQQPRKETYQTASSSSLTLGKPMARNYLSASAVVKSPTRATPSGPPSMSSATLGQSGTRKVARDHLTFAPAAHARMTSTPSNFHQPSYAVPSQEIRSKYRKNMVPAKRRAGESDTDRRENQPRMTPTAEQQGAYPACETHALVPSVDFIKSLAPEARTQIKSLRVMRQGVGEVIFTEPIDLSRDEILENVAGKLVRVMSSTTVTFLHGSIIGYPLDGTWRHPLLSSFAFVCHKSAERLEVDMNDHLDAFRGKLGAWEFQLSPQSPSEMDSVQPGHHNDMPWKLTTNQQRRKHYPGPGGFDCNTVSSSWHIVKHISLVYLRYAPGIAGNIDQKLVQIVGVTRYNWATKTRYLVAAAFETYPAIGFSAMKIESSGTVELWDMGVLEFSEVEFFSDFDGMYESQALEFIRHTRNQRPLPEARQAALAVNAHTDEPMAMVTDEFHLFGGGDPMRFRNPWVAKSSVIDGAHDEAVDLLCFGELKALLERPQVTEDCSDSRFSASKAPEDEELTVHDAQQSENSDDSDQYTEEEPDPESDEDYIPPYSRGRKVSSTSAPVSYLTSVGGESSSPLHDDQGLVNSIERQAGSHRLMSSPVMEEDQKPAADQASTPQEQSGVPPGSPPIAMEGDQQPAADVASPPERQSEDRRANHTEGADSQPQMTGQVLEVLQAMLTGMEARMEARLNALEDRNLGHNRGT